jgi:hypothetical protein
VSSPLPCVRASLGVVEHQSDRPEPSLSPHSLAPFLATARARHGDRGRHCRARQAPRHRASVPPHAQQMASPPSSCHAARAASSSRPGLSPEVAATGPPPSPSPASVAATPRASLGRARGTSRGAEVPWCSCCPQPPPPVTPSPEAGRARVAPFHFLCGRREVEEADSLSVPL